MGMPTYRTVAHDFISVMKTETGSKNVKVEAPYFPTLHPSIHIHPTSTFGVQIVANPTTGPFSKA